MDNREAITLQLKAAWWAERARETPEAELEAILCRGVASLRALLFRIRRLP